MPTTLVTWIALIGAAAALEFFPCPELNTLIANESPATDLATFDCANVSVPLDYTIVGSEPLELNLFRVPATEEPVLGNVLINFGGPGGTGAQNLPPFAEALRDIIGPQWNLVSWDPRGTGKTIPFKCVTPTGSAGSNTNTKRDLGSLVSTNATKGFLEYNWDFAGQLAEACAEQASDVGQLIGTAFVARDVMKIVDALDDGNLLHFFGWSYGSALGSYIAAMFPDRIGRMVLDGNVNPTEYQTGTYLNAANDIDEAFDGFLRTCFAAQDDCSLYSFVQPDSAEDLLAAINAGISPLASAANTGGEAYLAYLTVKSAPISPLYFPRQWPALADTLTGLLKASSASSSAANTTSPSTSNATMYDEAENAVLGIRASDATFHANSSNEYLAIAQEQSQVSDGFGDSFYFSIRASARWLMPAKERYWGDFNKKTSTPILYVNGEFDPVTPIVGAYNASAGFTGSVVLAHTGYGHGLLASPSRCASKYVQRYFKTAALPANGTTCEPDASTLEVWEAIVQASTNTTGGANATSSSSGSANSSDSNPSQPESSVPVQENATNSLIPLLWAALAVSAATLLGMLLGS